MPNGEWANRIAGYGEVDPATLVANPKNWRLHPAHQQAALFGSLADIGWVQDVIVNQTTGLVVDGHARVALAIKHQQNAVPVKYVTLTEPEEAMVLATLDPIAALATRDDAALTHLLGELETEREGLRMLLDELATAEPVLPVKTKINMHELDPERDRVWDQDGPRLPESWTTYDWETEPPWGVPILIADLAADPPKPKEQFLRWGSISRSSDIAGRTWHFYTEDYKFEGLFQNPNGLVLTNCGAITEPNVSTFAGMPRAMALAGVYRKRWLSRFVQDYGIKVWVDCNVHPEFRDLCLLGVPREWRAYITRGSGEDALNWVLSDWETVTQHTGTEQVDFLVYGGPKEVRAEAERRGWLWMAEDAQVKADAKHKR